MDEENKINVFRYGRKNCKHDWKYRSDGYEEQCAPLVCAKCGAFACACNLLENRLRGELIGKEWDEFVKNGIPGKVAPKGKKWNNPYVKEEK